VFDNNKVRQYKSFLNLETNCSSQRTEQIVWASDKTITPTHLINYCNVISFVWSPSYFQQPYFTTQYNSILFLLKYQIFDLSFCMG